MWSRGFCLRIIFLAYTCILHYSLATSCGAGNHTHFEINHNPSKLEAKNGHNVSFTCAIDDKYNVRTLYVRKDLYNVLIVQLNGSSKPIVSYRADNVFFSVMNNHFTISVLVRNESDWNTYYCDAIVEEQPKEICGAGTFIIFPLPENGSLRVWVIVSLVVIVVVVVVVIVCGYYLKSRK